MATNSSLNVKSARGQKPVTKRLKKILPWLTTAILLAAAAYFYQDYQKAVDSPSASISEAGTDESNKVIDDLEHILLIDETDKPTVARVDDPEMLRRANKAFYEKAMKNDYLILYPGRAILFRQSAGQIINLAPIIDTSDLMPPENSNGESEQ